MMKRINVNHNQLTLLLLDLSLIAAAILISPTQERLIPSSGSEASPESNPDVAPPNGFVGLAGGFSPEDDVTGDGIAQLLLRVQVPPDEGDDEAGGRPAQANQVQQPVQSELKLGKDIEEFIDWERVFSQVQSAGRAEPESKSTSHQLDGQDQPSLLIRGRETSQRPPSPPMPTSSRTTNVANSGAEAAPGSLQPIENNELSANEGDEGPINKRDSRECELACTSFCLANFAGAMGRWQKRHLFGCIEQCKRQRCR